VAVFPFAAGWSVVMGPLRGKEEDTEQDGADDGFVRICSLDALPADGIPRAFPVASDVVNAWTRSVGQRVGEVFLTRGDADGKQRILAFTATCPHLGCAVEFDDAEGRYECPCHESAFAKDGAKMFGPSLRGLDKLDVKLKGEAGAQEIWVRFERFRAGVAERVRLA
jgi:nitrite reductase/ring-hydroxylating ferredoxin subunit